jgi:hypothetical protein
MCWLLVRRFLGAQPAGDRLGTSSSVAEQRFRQRRREKSWYNAIKVWELQHGREVLALESPSTHLELSFSEDGNLLRGRDLTGMSAGVGTTFIWDATPVER